MQSVILCYLLFIPLCVAVLSLGADNKALQSKVKIISASLALFALPLVFHLTAKSVIYGYEISYSFTKSTTLYPLAVSRYGLIFLTLLSLIYPFGLIYTFKYLEETKHKKQSIFLVFYNLSMFAGFGMSLAGNMLILLVFYELITLFSYPLILGSATKESISASRSYLLYLVGTSVVLLMPALSYVYSKTNMLGFYYGGTIASVGLSKTEINVLYLMFVIGFAKTAIWPVSGWLIKAMVAPAPVSALLHSLVVVKSGLFGLFLITYKVFGLKLLQQNLWSIGGVNILTLMSTFTIISAGIAASKEQNLKKRFAYSTINQVSLAILMISTLSFTGIQAAMVQFLTHGIVKFTLFSALGCCKIVNGDYQLQGIGNLWKRSPITGITMFITCLALLGIPPTSGFYVKYQMLTTAFGSENYFIFGVIVLATILSFMYTFEILYNLMPKNANNKSKGKFKKIPHTMQFTLVYFCYLIIVSAKPIKEISALLTF